MKRGDWRRIASMLRSVITSPAMSTIPKWILRATAPWRGLDSHWDGKQQASQSGSSGRKAMSSKRHASAVLNDPRESSLITAGNQSAHNHNRCPVFREVGKDFFV